MQKNTKDNFFYLNTTKEMKQKAMEYHEETVKIETEKTTIHNDKMNYIARLGELAIQEQLRKDGFDVTDNESRGQGNSFDFWLSIFYADGKVRRFDSGTPNETWYFPFYMKEWVKMMDFYTSKQTLEYIFCLGYDSKKDDIIVYGYISPDEILELYTKYNLNDDLPNKERKVRYFPKGYWLGGTKAVDHGILITIDLLHPYHTLLEQR